MPATKVQPDMERVAAICRRWRIKDVSLFGSVLRDDFRDDSDVDLLISFEPGVRPSLEDWMGIEADFAQLFGRRVDVVERRLVQESRNYIRRREILSTARPIYGA